MSSLLTTTLKQHFDSHPEDCTCFLCTCHRATIKELGGRCPEHNVVRAVCRCSQPKQRHDIEHSPVPFWEEFPK